MESKNARVSGPSFVSEVTMVELAAGVLSMGAVGK